MTLKKHRLIQTVCFVAAALLLWPLPFWTDASKIVVPISPFVAVCTCIAMQSIGWGFCAGLVVAGVAAFRRRWFCKYACPVVLLVDGFAAIGLQKHRWWVRCPSLGQYLVILTFAGSIVGYPLFLWMDPLALFSNAFTIRTSGSPLAAVLSATGLAGLLFLSFTSGPVWCARFCPLGGTLDLLASMGAGLRGGPRRLASQFRKWRTDSVQDPQGRRSFILAASGLIVGLLVRSSRAVHREDAPLRPPGAVAEAIFTGMCLRCGNCVRSCPTRIIHADTGCAGVAGLLAPILRFDKKYCIEGCAACTQTCPSGALRPLELQEKRRFVIGEALMDANLCVLALGQRDCDACAAACPYEAVQIHWDEEQYIAYPVVDFKKCNGCGACETACPTPGDKAMRVWNSRRSA